MKITFLLFLFMIFQVNCFSQISFEKTYGKLNNEQGWNVIQLADSSYIISGSTRSFGSPEGDFYLLKVDKYGNLSWQNNYGHNDPEFC